MDEDKVKPGHRDPERTSGRRDFLKAAGGMAATVTAAGSTILSSIFRQEPAEAASLAGIAAADRRPTVVGARNLEGLTRMEPPGLAGFTRETFSQCLNTSFRIDVGAEKTVEFSLIAVKENTSNRSASTGVTECFSLFFRGPARRPLSQDTYRMEHDRLGPLTLFIVPMGANRAERRYEAVFNRLVDRTDDRPI